MFRDKLLNIFFPDLQSDISRVNAQKQRFVHYTTASAAMNILTKKEIWLRQTSLMNDTSEIKHGASCLSYAFHSTETNLISTLESFHKGIADEIAKNFDEIFLKIIDDLYILSISEHRDFEDGFGRLSMWRAYGANAGVAIVLKNEIFSENDDGDDENEVESPEVVLPVNYYDSNGFVLSLKRICENLNKEKEFVARIERDHFKELFTLMFKWLVLSSKHPGFAEEKEWRMIYSPIEGPSPSIEKELVNFNGIPQEVCKFSLDKIPKAKGGYFAIDEVIDRIVIGPTSFGYPMQKSFVSLLENLGVANPSSKVFLSNIPLRT